MTTSLTNPTATLDAGAAPAPVAPAVPSLRRNFLVTLTGNVVYAACQWGILVVFAKLTSTESVGVFVLGLAVATPVFLLANLQLAGVQATDARRETPFEAYLRLRLVTTLLGCLVVAGIVAACRYEPRVAAVVLLACCAKACDSVSDIFHGFYQQQERMHHIAASLTVNAVASLGGVGVALAATHDVVWASAAFALGSAASLALYNLPTGAKLWRTVCAGSPVCSLRRAVFATAWDWDALWRLAWLAAPVGLAAGLAALNGTVPRYFIHSALGDRALGIFAAMAYIMTAGTTFVGALCISAVPRLSRHYADRDLRGFARITAKILGVAGAAGAAGILVALVAGPQLLTLLYRPEYAQNHAVFVWLMVAAAATYASAVLGYAVTATRAFAMLTVPYVIVTAVTVAACAVLIPRYGLAGAAWALLASGVAACGAAVSILWRLWRRREHLEGRGFEISNLKSQI
jgi:O-antigen/teichoic acid export membrane protein